MVFGRRHRTAGMPTVTTTTTTTVHPPADQDHQRRGMRSWLPGRSDPAPSTTAAPEKRSRFGSRRKDARGTGRSYPDSGTPVQPGKRMRFGSRRQDARGTAATTRRKPSLGDKMSGALMKMRGSINRNPGQKAAGTRRMHGTDGPAGRTVY